MAKGLLLTPKGVKNIVANVIVLPDADQTPEQMCGLAEGIAEESQVARHLAESGCRVVVPALMSRHREKRLGRADLTNREYLHRAAFELGRTLAGYEVQMSMSIVDWFSAQLPKRRSEFSVMAKVACWRCSRVGSILAFNVTCVSGFLGLARKLERTDRSKLRRAAAGFWVQELAMLVNPRWLNCRIRAESGLSLWRETAEAPAVLESISEETTEAQMTATAARSLTLLKLYGVVTSRLMESDTPILDPFAS
jgi:hypothetical protein